MSFKNKLSSVITMAVAVVAFSTFASAQDTAAPSQDGAQKQEKREGRSGRRGMKRSGFGRHGGGMGLRGITLTDAQKEQLRVIHESNKPDEATMQEMRSIMEARRAGSITDAQKERMKVLREQNRIKREAVQIQVMAILTPEQRAQLEARKAERQKRMEERKQLRQQRKSAPDKPTDN